MIFITAFLGVGILNANVAENEKGYMDPRAVEVLKNTSDFIGKAKTLSIKGTAIYDHVMESGIIVTYSKDIEVYIKRPNKFLVVMRGDDHKQRRIYFDGKSIVRFNANNNSYQKVSYAGEIDRVLDHIIDNYDVDLPLVDLIYNDMAGVLQESIISAEHMGERTIEVPRVTTCHMRVREPIGRFGFRNGKSPFLGALLSITLISTDRRNFWRCSRIGKSTHPWMRRFSPSIPRSGQKSPS